MNKNEKLHHLEHRIIRDLFFAGGTKTLRKLSSWHFYRQVVNILNRLDPEEKITLEKDDLTVTKGRLGEAGATFLKVDLPDPKEAALCKTIYMVYSDDPSEKLYLTVERYEDGSFGLCGWLSPKCHVSFETDIHYSAWGERQRIEEIFEELPETKRALEELTA